MALPGFCRVVRSFLLALLPFSLLSIAQAQGARKTAPETPVVDAHDDHVQERSEWFLRGRVVPEKSSAELRYRAYQAKMRARAARLARAQAPHSNSQPAVSSGAWTPLGPVPLASDATGDGFQNYNQVSGRATAVAIDPGLHPWLAHCAYADDHRGTIGQLQFQRSAGWLVVHQCRDSVLFQHSRDCRALQFHSQLGNSWQQLCRGRNDRRNHVQFSQHLSVRAEPCCLLLRTLTGVARTCSTSNQSASEEAPP